MRVFGFWGRVRLLLGGLGVLLACPGVAVAAPEPGAARHYELVSDVLKAGNSVGRGSVLEGDHVLFKSSGSLSDDDTGFGVSGYYLASRSATAWTIASTVGSAFTIPKDVSAALEVQIFQEPKALVPDDQDLFPGPAGQAGISQPDTYVRDGAGLRRVSFGSVGGNGAFPANYAGRSANGEHLLFQTEEVLEPEDVGRDPDASDPGPYMVYERVGNVTRAVGLDSDEKPISSGGAVLAGMPSEGFEGQQSPVSADGSRVFFESPDPNTGGLTQLYVREDGETTTEVSAPQRVTPGNAPQPVAFQGASVDGGRVFFMTTGQLTEGDVDGGLDMYSYVLATQKLTRVSGGPLDTIQDAGVMGVTRVSDDGMRIYFLATGVLAQGGVLGEYNMYLYDADDGSTTLVSRVTVNDQSGLLQQGLEREPVDVAMTPDGSTLVFHAEAKLTSFDNQSCVDTGGPCAQVYMYRVGVPGVQCLSCNDAGTPPLGGSVLPVKLQNAFAGARRPNQFVSDDGTLVAFQTQDALVREDTNGQVDPYVWQSGTVSLVSSGRSDAASALVGMGADGRDVFFTTDEQLSALDGDQITDLYDARVGPDLPAPTEGKVPCEGDPCQGAPTSPPTFPGPASALLDRPDDKALPPRASFSLGRLTARQRATFARTGKLEVKVRVNRAGLVTAKVIVARRALASVRKRASKAGTMRLTLRVSERARKRQLTLGRTRATLSVKFAGVHDAAERSLPLPSSAKRGGRAK